MAKNLDMNFNLLSRELNLITKNIHLVKSKSHYSISKIVNNIKNTTNNYKNDYKAKLKTEKINYKKYKPNIYLYPNYKENKKENYKIHNKTINNCTIASSKFFLDKNNIINIKKNSFNNKKITIDFNSNYHLVKSNSAIIKYNKKGKSAGCLSSRDTNKKKLNINICNKNDINEFLYFDYKNKKEFEKLNKKNINISADYFKPKHKNTKNFNSINATRVKHNSFRKNNLLINEKKFLNQMCNIYNKYNDPNKSNDIYGYGYDKIILWIKDLINKKTRMQENNKYEHFCKQLMKENNINDFSSFQSFAKNNINEEKNANFFIKDMKKILFKDIN